MIDDLTWYDEEPIEEEVFEENESYQPVILDPWYDHIGRKRE